MPPSWVCEQLRDALVGHTGEQRGRLGIRTHTDQWFPSCPLFHGRPA
jgi:hypothetical protein